MSAIIFAIIGAVIGGIAGFCLELLSCVVDTVACFFGSSSGGGVEMYSIIIPCAIIGGIIGLFIGIYTDKEDAKLLKAKEEQDRRDAEQAKLDSAFSEWDNRLASCYNAIENNIGLNILFDPDDLYEPIWELEKTQPEARYKEAFEQRLSKHINLLRRKIDYNLLNGYYAVSMSLTSARCLKKAHHEDSRFNSAIETLTKLYKRMQSDSFCIEFLQYGDCKLPIEGLQNQVDLDARIATLKNKLQAIDASFRRKDYHYRNIIPDMANFNDYAAELIWCIAERRPFNQNEFDEACRLFSRNTRKCCVDNTPYVISQYEKAYSGSQNGHNFCQIEHVEQLLALIYAKNLIGGQNTVNQERKKILKWVDAAIAFGMTNQCYMLPSALAWMGLYELERDVLQHLVEVKVNLPEEWQDRLGFLESGGTSNIKIYDASPDSGFLYDSSSLEWNTDAFDLFFRKLEMTHRPMRYSLAVSKWTKTLPLARGQKVTLEQIEDSFKQLVEDFDGEVIMRKETAQALNLSNVEYENSFIFRFRTERNKRNKCVSVLFSSEKYGRNLNLTIIVLFTPEDGLSSEELRKYALAIKDNVYMESFRESILQAVDEVIRPEQPIYDNEPSDKSEAVIPEQTAYDSEPLGGGEVFE